jgi:hypothetical protein
MSAVFGIDEQHEHALRGGGYVCVDKQTEMKVLDTLRSVRAADIVFVKKFSAQSGLNIKAVGIALSAFPTNWEGSVCLPVEWVWRGEKKVEPWDENCSCCADPFYEEHNITVQRELIDLMPEKLQIPPEW